VKGNHVGIVSVAVIVKRKLHVFVRRICSNREYAFRRKEAYGTLIRSSPLLFRC
jgi:hypothetical protein